MTIKRPNLFHILHDIMQLAMHFFNWKLFFHAIDQYKGTNLFITYISITVIMSPYLCWRNRNQNKDYAKPAQFHDPNQKNTDVKFRTLFLHLRSVSVQKLYFLL